MKHWLLVGVGLLGIVMALMIGYGIVAGQIVWPGGNRTGQASNQTLGADASPEQIGRNLANGSCEGSGPGTLTHAPMDPDDFGSVVPYGLMVGGHVTPIDHQYFSPAEYDSPRDAYPVYAMGDARLVFIEHRTEQPQDNDTTRSRVTDEYRLIFSQTCTSLYYYDLLTSLTPELTAEFEARSKGRRSVSVDIPVKGGEEIGRIGGQTLDFAVWDTTKPLDGFVVPEHYQYEPWKRYTADPLDYYTPELREFLLTRYPRIEEPLSGKIDWDLDGTLRGTWFVEGTDYQGDVSDPTHSWKTHLSFAPDLYDHEHFVISMGEFAGEAQQFSAKSNTPQPAEVTPDSGLVKYELVHAEYVGPNGRVWDRKSLINDPKVKEASFVIGTVLVQLTDPRTLQFEAFPGQTADQVSGFTASATLYTR